MDVSGIREKTLPSLAHVRAAWPLGTLRTHLSWPSPFILLGAEGHPSPLPSSSFSAGPATASANWGGLFHGFLLKVHLRITQGRRAGLTLILWTRVVSHLSEPPTSVGVLNELKV